MCLTRAWDVVKLLHFIGYSVISTMVQNAVRAIPLGQFAGQEIVLRSFSQLEKIDTGNSRIGRVLPWGQYAWS